MRLLRALLGCAVLASAALLGWGQDVAVPKGESSIEAVFVLDTTGSMGGLIQGAKDKIWAIANMMVTTKPKPKIKIGLIGYRDRGDDYITKITPLTDDLDAVYADLLKFQAGGGGDGPESVNQALHEAVTKMAWSTESGIYRVIFLVGDYPPHMDYDNDVKYQDSCALAVKAHIIVNTIQCGAYEPTTPIWQEVARLSEGQFFKVDQSGGAVVVATPFDGKLAGLSKQLDETRVFYGTETEQARGKAQLTNAREINAGTPASAAADRATYAANVDGEKGATGAGAVGFFSTAGSRDLLNDIVNGVTALEKVDAKLLPENLQKMTPEERATFIKDLQERRTQLMKEIAALSTQRAQFQADELKKRAATGKPTFESAVAESVATQRAKVEGEKK